MTASMLSGGTPGRDRTCDLRIRSPSLCPTELRAPRSPPARHGSPARDSPGGGGGERRDLNPQPLEPQSSALTIELRSPSWARPLVRKALMVRTAPGPCQSPAPGLDGAGGEWSLVGLG